MQLPGLLPIERLERDDQSGPVSASLPQELYCLVQRGWLANPRLAQGKPNPSVAKNSGASCA